jgi:hypothetical protein
LQDHCLDIEPGKVIFLEVFAVKPRAQGHCGRPGKLAG